MVAPKIEILEVVDLEGNTLYYSYKNPSVRIKDPLGKRGAVKSKYFVKEKITSLDHDNFLFNRAQARTAKMAKDEEDNAAGRGPRAEANGRIREGMFSGFKNAGIPYVYAPNRYAPTKAGRPRKVGTARDSVLKNTNASVALVKGYALNPENRAVLNQIYGEEIASAYRNISKEFDKYAATLASNTPGGARGPARYLARKDTDAMKPWEKKFYVNQVIPKKEKALRTRANRFGAVLLPIGMSNDWREHF